MGLTGASPAVCVLAGWIAAKVSRVVSAPNRLLPSPDGCGSPALNRERERRGSRTGGSRGEWRFLAQPKDDRRASEMQTLRRRASAVDGQVKGVDVVRRPR